MKVFVAGHRGMVGGAIVRKLLAQGVLPSQNQVIMPDMIGTLGLTRQVNRI